MARNSFSKHRSISVGCLARRLMARYNAPIGPPDTLRSACEWFWLGCYRCHHRVATRPAIFINLFGPDYPLEGIRQRGWCTMRGNFGAYLRLAQLGQWLQRTSVRIFMRQCRPEPFHGNAGTLRAGETYRVFEVMEFACPCGRSDALLDVGVDFAWCQTRFRLLPKPKAGEKSRQVSAPKEKETVR